MALFVGCGTSRTYDKGRTQEPKVSIRREEEDAISLLAQRHKLLFRAKVIL